ncbi:DJ-1/PfpI/YhbO family deglycase/protease [Rivularia sp. UHCC 0363]|uniref:DJ-1/PfpI/YhbO family deglycase/protease n=1 Tax=Rivularia sp. UHCC 0363 TaxID=3110244 RepID=UPI002B215832|nr:DJ-1/PfpI/YhbO family deglycase/protease [Rivularia sp. UHCC 0363]MEA5593834.1 DJ-1/PfpI/YhbO family deglycase/protease [Rivularia sp. UHCC 0363]
MVSTNNNSGKKKVAILIENGVEDSEFQVPYQALKQAGIEVSVLGSRMNEAYKGKQGKVSQEADGTTTEAMASDFDAVIIPGGMAPDKMRLNPNTVRFVQEAMSQGKLVAAVCHGPQLLIEGDLLKGRTATGFSAIRKDMINAGANYEDKPLVVDGNLITSRQPGDLPIFATAILSRLGYGGKEADLPSENDQNAEWWKIGDAWGGSHKSDIVKGLNTVLAGERYSHKALETYAEKASDTTLKSLFQEMIASKEVHIHKLEARLDQFGEKPSLSTKIAEAYAKVKNSIKGSDDIYQIRCALGDLQTAINDIATMMTAYTDPVTTETFTQIQKDLMEQEQRLVDLYRTKVGGELKPAKPTTGTAV